MSTKKPEEKKSKVGRPTTDPKTYRRGYRLSADDVEKLKYCSETLNISTTEVIRRGIDKVYSELQEDSEKGSDKYEKKNK